MATSKKKRSKPTESKTAKVIKMLQRKSGATREEICKVTDWTAINVLAVGLAHGLKMTKSKERPFTYYGAASKARKPAEASA